MKGDNKKTLLLVEDEASIALAKQIELEKYGYNVLTVNTGEKAVAIAKENHEIDLILMDINLGSGIDGTEAAEIILKDQGIPVVFLSSHTNTETVEKTEKITSYGYVVKSSNITVLDASIKMAFKLFKANKQIEESDIKQKAMLSDISDVIGIIGMDGIMKYESPNIEKWFGWLPEDLIGTNGFNNIHPDDSERIQKGFANLVEEDNSTITVEYRYKCKDGSYKPVELTAQNFMNDPIIDGVLLNYRDITERNRMVSALRKSEERIKNSLDNLIEGCQMIGFDWRFLYLNETAVSQGHKTREEFLGRTMMEVLPGIEDTELFTIMKRVMEEREIQHFINEFTYWDGTKGWFELSIQPVEEGIFILSMDITERKLVEEELTESRERVNLALKGAELGMWDYNIPQDTRIFDERSVELLGSYPKNDKEFVLLIHPDDIKPYNEAWDALEEGKEPIYIFEYRIRDLSGQYRWLMEKGKIVEWDSNKNPIRATGTIQDITERKRTEEEKLKFTYAVEQSPSIVIIKDMDQRIRYVNPMFTQVSGYLGEEVIGKKPHFLNAGDFSSAKRKVLMDKVFNGQIQRTTSFEE